MAKKAMERINLNLIGQLFIFFIPAVHPRPRYDRPERISPQDEFAGKKYLACQKAGG
jgi:hypothetical protein